MFLGIVFGVLVGNVLYIWMVWCLVRCIGCDDVIVMLLGLDVLISIGMVLLVFGLVFLVFKV